MAASRRVLVAEEVREFASRVAAPDDIEIEWLPATRDVPSGDYVGLLPLLTRRIDASLVDRLPNLKVVANYAVGFDNIDLAALRKRGIAVSNTPDVLTEATADLTWALILAVTRRVNEAEHLAREGEWAWHPTLLLGTQLGGLTLGLLGAGRIGQAVGRRAVPFGMEIAYWDRQAQAEFEAEVGARRYDSLEDILAVADVVSVHLQLSQETADLIGAESISV
ncbi:MAG: NAD(P)-dependent oxidoreductase, partial [Gemmatimonadales bacterium]